MTALQTSQSNSKIIAERFLEAARTFEQAAEPEYLAAIEQAAEILCEAFERGKKLLVFGNGGSASDAQHLAGELVVRFQNDRRAFPVVALSSDSTVLTACGNDYGFVHVFARQIEALGQAGDVALGISTSGKSENVLRAFEAAKNRGLTTILLTGRAHPIAGETNDLVLAAPGSNTARIQEVHLASYHALCELIENYFRRGN